MENEETNPSADSTLTTNQKLESFQNIIEEGEVRGWGEDSMWLYWKLIFQEKLEKAESETNNRKTLAYLCKILAGVFETDKEEDFQDHSVFQAEDTQDCQLTQEYDVETDQDIKGDRLNFN